MIYIDITYWGKNPSPEVEIFNIQGECIIVQSIQNCSLINVISTTLNAKNKYMLGQ